jgi:hypothetical protein
MTDTHTSPVTAALLPCPFCGGEAKCSSRPTGIMGQIYCDGEECFGPRTTALTKQNSIVQWNTRNGVAQLWQSRADTTNFTVTEHCNGSAQGHIPAQGSPIPRASGDDAKGGWRLDFKWLQKLSREIENATGYQITIECTQEAVLRTEALLALPSTPSAPGGPITCLDETGLQITVELYKAVNDLKGASPCLLAMIGSWGDTLNDSDVLDGLKRHNEMGECFIPDVTAVTSTDGGGA